MPMVDDPAAALAAAGIPIETWGRDEAKTVEHLLAEIAAGESGLLRGEHGLIRTLRGACVTLSARTPDGVVYLAEDHQRFSDGRVRRRDHLRFSIGEKLCRGETPEDGALRALAEELGMPPLPLTPWYVEDKAFTDDYPGLLTMCTVWHYTAEVPRWLYAPEGYTERQADKTTVFTWRAKPFTAPPWAQPL